MVLACTNIRESQSTVEIAQIAVLESVRFQKYESVFDGAGMEAIEALDGWLESGKKSQERLRAVLESSGFEVLRCDGGVVLG